MSVPPRSTGPRSPRPVRVFAGSAPAGAITLIVGPGLLRTSTQPVVAFAAVVLVTVVDWLFTRATGARTPIWGGRDA